MLIPLISFDRIDPGEANRYLVFWAHKMGPCTRPFPVKAYSLVHNTEVVGVIMHGPIISPQLATEVMGDTLTRARTIEVTRLCAARPHLCRVVLRLWREFAFPDLVANGECQFAVSYQDADAHTGNTSALTAGRGSTTRLAGPTGAAESPGARNGFGYGHQ